ncbi:unnamed protein product [Arabidopsis halleri]
MALVFKNEVLKAASLQTFLQSPVSQPSSSSAFSVNSRDRRNGKFGLPRGCFCGGSMNLERQLDGLDQGHLVFKCQRHEDGGLNVNKYWYMAIEEEIHDLHMTISEQKDQLSYLTRCGEGNGVDPSMIWSQVYFHDKEINRQKKSLEDCVDGLKDLHNHLPSTMTPTANNSTSVGILLSYEKSLAILAFLSFLIIALAISLIK